MDIYGLTLPAKTKWKDRTFLLNINLPNEILLLICEYGTTFDLIFSEKNFRLRNAFNFFKTIKVEQDLLMFDPGTFNIQMSIKYNSNTYDLLSDNTWRKRMLVIFVEYPSCLMARTHLPTLPKDAYFFCDLYFQLINIEDHSNDACKVFLVLIHSETPSIGNLEFSDLEYF